VLDLRSKPVEEDSLHPLSFANVIDSVLGVVMMSAIDLPLRNFEVSSSCLRPGLDRLSHTCIYCRHHRIRPIRQVKGR
jgi:hypothetical protein